MQIDPLAHGPLVLTSLIASCTCPVATILSPRLPSLSSQNSALEELRAAHNLVSSVPSSLGKNVALRTLDLGHNSIEGWDGLERVGKSLTSLVQLTLAGNPLCGNASAAGTRALSQHLSSAEEPRIVLQRRGCLFFVCWEKPEIEDDAANRKRVVVPNM